jgi:LAO/AO transport system kinase
MLSRALTLVESRNKQHQVLAEQLLTRLMPRSGGAIRVGISGPPGAGKSTFIESLGVHLTGTGSKVGVLAVDPSSGVTGGSILGDKTRMARLAAEPLAYIRPAPSSGAMGGVARKTRESMLVCEAAGFDVMLIETVGVGQSETMVADMTDCFLAIMMPGAGDELQGIKRGLLELVDVIAVNKADGDSRQAAETAARQYRTALRSLADCHTSEVPPVLTCSALHNEGVHVVWDAIQRHVDCLANRGVLAERRRRQNVRWLWAAVEELLRTRLAAHPAVRAIRDDLEEQASEGTIPIEAAARRLLEAFDMPAATE